MKRLTFTFALFVLMLVSGMTMAQPQPGNKGMGPGRQIEWMKKELALTPDQEVKITEINKKYAQLMVDLREKYQSDREGMRDEMMKMRDERIKDYKAVLTEEQYNKFVEHQKEMMKNRNKEKEIKHSESQE
ncbi:MAG: hypothetical protein Q8862_06335 [Bacteroidota bacterium]|nr:hypothetical protein [Bacteroidota bacterium]